jgi:hypothetical protein
MDSERGRISPGEEQRDDRCYISAGAAEKQHGPPRCGAWCLARVTIEWPTAVMAVGCPRRPLRRWYCAAGQQFQLGSVLQPQPRAVQLARDPLTHGDHETLGNEHRHFPELHFLAVFNVASGAKCGKHDAAIVVLLNLRTQVEALASSMARSCRPKRSCTSPSCAWSGSNSPSQTKPSSSRHIFAARSNSIGPSCWRRPSK